MSHDRDTELTREERAAFASLPREAAPSDLLEERVVRALRTRHLLAPRRALWHRGTRLVAGLAASLTLFLGGTVFGQWLAGRTSAEALSAAREIRRMDTDFAAVRVQQTGSAYVAALASLHQQREAGVRPGAKPGAKQDDALVQGWEAALSALRAATEELARMDPHDSRVAQALEALEGEGAGANGETAPSQGTNQALWF
jgi:hypothetical protein